MRKEQCVDPTGVEADCTWIDDSTIRVAWVARNGWLQVADYDATTLARKRMVYEKTFQCVFPRVSGEWLAYKAASPGDWGCTLEHPFGTVIGTFPPNEWASGNNPCDISDNGQFFAHSDYGLTFHVKKLPSLEEVWTSVPQWGGSVGIEQLLDDGTAISRDSVFAKTPGIANKFEAGPFIIGESNDGSLGPKGLIVRAGTKQAFMFRGIDTDDPRASLHPDGRLAIVCGIAHGCYIGVITQDELDLNVPVPPPPPPDPNISLSASPEAGVAPLAVHGSFKTDGALRTWRWLVNGSIVLPYDGYERDFTFEEGTYDMKVHAQTFGGKVIDTPCVRITVNTTPIRTLPFHGLNAWMPGDAGLAAEVLKRKWKLWRGGFEAQPDPVVIENQIREAWGWGSEVFALVTPSQVKDLPKGINAEVLDCDRMKNGKPPFPEPNLRFYDPKDGSGNPTEYAKTVNALVPIAKARNIQLWAGASNMDATAWWKAFVKDLDPYVGLTPHRYPRDARKPENPQVGAKDREEEIAIWKAATGNRPFVVSEFGYCYNLQMKWSGDVWKVLAKIPFLTKYLTYQLTEQQVADFVKWEFAYWQRHGATAAILYQLNTGEPGNSAGENWGIRRYSTNPFDWRPVADIL